MKRIAPLAAFILAACSTTAPMDAQVLPSAPPSAISQLAEELVAQDNIAGIGLARIEDGQVVWMGYYGEQAPGVPVGPRTAFNVASVSKVVLAETVLRLVDDGAMSLDDPIDDFYTHPDLAEDPRYRLLTPRIILSHQAALKNWAYEYEDNRLAFIGEPGVGELHYSGAAIQILARYLEARFPGTYPQIVQRELLGPIGIAEIAPGREDWLDGRVASPNDGEGRRWPVFTNDPSGALIASGEWNAADNLYATVPGFSDFLVELIAGDDLSPALQAERSALLSTSSDGLGYVCIAEPQDCPDPLGYALGWGVFGEPDRTVLNHGGNDFAEHAQVWFVPETREGFIMFVNGGNAFADGLRIVEAVDPGLLMARHYRALIERMREGG